MKKSSLDSKFLKSRTRLRTLGLVGPLLMGFGLAFQEVYAEHPATGPDFSQICQLARDSIRFNQRDITALKSPDNANVDYQQLIDEYNQALARYTLFTGVNTIINNYINLHANIEKATSMRSAMEFGVFMSHVDTTSVFSLNDITDVVMIEQSITNILGNTISMEQLSQFSGPVCPTQNISSSELATCPASVKKVSPLLLALRGQCSFSANQSAPLCQTINLLDRPSNVIALDKTNELLESFRTNYRNAYLIEHNRSSELNDPRSDMLRLKQALSLLSYTEVSSDGNIRYTVDADDPRNFLTTEQLNRQEQLQGIQTGTEPPMISMELIVGHAENLNQVQERSVELYHNYSQCFADITARAAAKALCPDAPEDIGCEHATSFTPRRIEWQRQRIQICQDCYNTDIRKCITPEQLTEFYSDGNVPTGGVRDVIRHEVEQFATTMETAAGASPLIRQLASNGLIDRTAGLQSQERALELAGERIRDDLTSLGNKGSLFYTIEQISREETHNAQLLMNFAERSGGGVEILPSDLIQNLYTGNNEESRIFRRTFIQNYRASQNENILLGGLRSGNAIDDLNGRLEANTTAEDSPEMFHQILGSLLEMQNASEHALNLNCMTPTTGNITQQYLDQNRQNQEVLGGLLHRCMEELGGRAGDFCDELTGDQMIRCQRDHQNYDNFIAQKRNQERLLTAINEKIRNIEDTSAYRTLANTQQQLFSLVRQTCKEDSSIRIVTCQNKTTMPYAASRGALSFLVSNTNEILGSLSNIGEDRQTPYQIIRSFTRSGGVCPSRSVSRTPQNQLPICTYRLTSSPLVAAETSRTNGPLSEDFTDGDGITDTEIEDNTQTESSTRSSHGHRDRSDFTDIVPSERPRRTTSSNLRPVPRATTPIINPNVINSAAASFGSTMGSSSYYGQFSSPYSFNNGVFGLTSNYAFPSYPLGFSPYTGAFHSFSLSPGYTVPSF